MKKVLPTVLIVLVFIAGIAVFLYPTVSNYLYQKNSTRAITEHSENLSQLSPEVIAEEKEAVRRYNKSLFENAVVLTDPFDPDAYPITDGEYTELLAFDDVMAYIEIPAINVYLPIYHGTEEETLLIGVGHLENTSLPAGGESTHAVLSAHCGLPSARLFTDLNLLREGNIFRIHVLDETLTYQVYEIETVDPDDSSSLFIQEGEDRVTLITCTPYGKNTHRLLVHGRRIEEKDEALIEEPKIEKKMTWEDYTKLAAIGITAVFVLLLLGSAVKGLIRRKKHEKAD
ncbi:MULTISPECIES: class C sortase [unclassified Candidatus Paralachnospira]|uniref:class C sortase n=1 Tax=unclassified Candidatus Paralachnospira TaxID=3099471 RepID=UPI003F8EAB62